MFIIFIKIKLKKLLSMDIVDHINQSAECGGSLEIALDIFVIVKALVLVFVSA